MTGGSLNNFAAAARRIALADTCAAVFLGSDLSHHASGYRPDRALAHKRTIDALPLILGDLRKGDAAYLDVCRIKRNAVEYDAAGGATDAEADELLQFATTLRVRGVLGQYTNQPVIERGKQPRFDWKEGLVGESTPDQVMVPAVEPVDLLSLVRELTDVLSEESDQAFAPANQPAVLSRLEGRRSGGITFPLLLEKKKG